MTHLFYFLGVLIIIVTYFATTYRFWRKKFNGIDTTDAIFATMCTTAFIVIAALIVIGVWEVTA